jgi:ribokinase
MAKPDIVVVGSSNTDLIMKMERLPNRAETVTDASFSQVFGGKGANQAAAAARAGGSVRFVACVGEDSYGDGMLDSFRADGIDTRAVFRESDTASGTALIMIDEAGNNLISVAPGANRLLTPEKIDGIQEHFAEAAAIVMQFEIPIDTIERVLELADARSVPVIWNIAPVRPFDRKLLAKVDILVANEVEAKAVTGTDVSDVESGRAAALELLELGARAAIVTIGANGSVVATRGQEGSSEEPRVSHIPAFEVEVVDTTAAGDTYCGCLAVALGEAKSMEDAVRFASAGAALSVQTLGAQPSAPTRGRIDAFLADRA